MIEIEYYRRERADGDSLDSIQYLPRWNRTKDSLGDIARCGP